MLFFGLSLVGIVLNLAIILLLLISSTVAYIVLGRKMRLLAQAQDKREQSSAFSQVSNPQSSSSSASIESTPSMASVNEGDDASEGDIKSGQPVPELSTLPGEDFKPMPDEALQTVKSIFSIDTFFSTDHTPYYNGAIFKGNLRGEADAVHARLSQRLHSLMGNQYRLFMMDDPSLNPPKPIVVILPSKNDPKASTWVQWLVATFLLIATSFTSMVAAASFQGFSLLENWDRWPDTLPLTLGIILILVSHEVGHWVTARQYGIRLAPPFLLPTWQIGSFGGLTRIESVMPHRTALFDVGFSGPAVGGVLSFGFLLVGLVLSHEGSIFQLSTTFFQSSVLVGVLARLTLGEQLQYTLVDIDPLVIVGWLGLLITAINVMPVGQLDGGRIVQAIYGRKILRRTSIFTLLVLAIATFFNPLALYWLVVILVLQRQLEQPQLNELTEPDDTRAVLGLVALFFMAAMLLPLSPELATRLGIGG